MTYDPYHIDLDEITQILHPTEAVKRMTDSQVPTVKFRCKVFNISSEEESLEYEELLTEVANGMDKDLVKQETHFNKFGEYIVALHWKERIEKDESKQFT